MEWNKESIFFVDFQDIAHTKIDNGTIIYNMKRENNNKSAEMKKKIVLHQFYFIVLNRTDGTAQ